MKPMLAATIEDITALKYPLLGSPKLDGIRALIIDGQLVSRNLKPIPNRFIQNTLPLKKMNGWDGELIVGKPNAKDCFRATTSGVMSEDGEPNFTFWVFDHIPNGKVNYGDRLKGLTANVRGLIHPRVRIVPQVKLVDPFAVHQYEEVMLERNYEGIMLRALNGEYKFGRSTLKEGYLMKLKRFADGEAVVLKLVEQMENTNEKTTDELGRSKRSSHKAGKVGKDTTGALRVRDCVTGVEFDIGTGLDDATRRRYWIMPHIIEKKIIKYKYFPSGSKDKPRFPVFLGVRED